MSRSIPRRSRSSSADLHGYKPALDRIDEHLARTNPELEQEKIKKAMRALFGPEPTGYDDDGMPYWADEDEDEILPEPPEAIPPAPIS